MSQEFCRQGRSSSAAKACQDEICSCFLHLIFLSAPFATLPCARSEQQGYSVVLGSIAGSSFPGCWFLAPGFFQPQKPAVLRCGCCAQGCQAGQGLGLVLVVLQNLPTCTALLQLLGFLWGGGGSCFELRVVCMRGAAASCTVTRCAFAFCLRLPSRFCFRNDGPYCTLPVLPKPIQIRLGKLSNVPSFSAG